MLIGEYTHTIDDKNRLSLPSKFRQKLGRSIIITRGFDNCLFVYTEDEWRRFTDKLSHMSVADPTSRAFSRFLLSGAVEVEIDSSGRVLIPDFLRSFSGILSKVVVIGVMTRVELWSEDRYRSYSAEIERDADRFAEQLSGIGMI